MKLGFRRLLQCTALTVFIGATASTAAFAQVAPQQQTGIASPDRANEQFLDDKPVMPRNIPEISVRDMKPGSVPAGAENRTFYLTGVDLRGVTVYSAEQLSGVFKDRVGTEISVAELFVIANDLTRKYRNDGYILTQVVVPEQKFSGRPTLQVVEGFVDQIEVRGEDHESVGSYNLIKDYADIVRTDGKALNSKDIERALLLINDLPGVSARSVLSPSKTKTGAADLTVIVERKPYDIQIGADNFGTRFLGPFQVSGAASANSFFGFNERLTAQVAIVPEDSELEYYAVNYRQPIWKYGTLFDFTMAHTFTDPGYTLDQFGVTGHSNSYGATFFHPFLRSRELSFTARSGLEIRNVLTKNNIPVDPDREDHITKLSVGGRAEYLEDFFGLAFNVLDFEVSRGLSIFGASDTSDVNVSRPNADPFAHKLEVEYQRLQRIMPSVNVLMGVQGQIAADAMLSSEEFGVGGINYGRGYDSSEIIGDDGIAGKLELQWNQPHEFSGIYNYQLFGFYDAGKVWNHDATAIPQKDMSLHSTGLGVRVDFTERTKGGFMIAFPLTRTPQTQGDKDPRFYVNINQEF